MFQIIQKTLSTKNILSHKNEGITICTVEDQAVGFELAKSILYGIVDKKTVFAISGLLKKRAGTSSSRP